MPETENRTTVVPMVNVVPRVQPLTYENYVSLQERLRRRRKELLLFCQHPPTLTAGVKSKRESLLGDPALLADKNINHVRIGRGGDYTAHEPGQCVIYPHIDLRARGIGVSEYFNQLLAISRTAIQETWNLTLENHVDAPGLYTAPAQSPNESRKLASIGIMFKSFFSSFGVAVNIANTLNTFQYINPCGDAELNMTTVADLGGEAELLPTFVSNWNRLFQTYLEHSPLTSSK